MTLEKLPLEGFTEKNQLVLKVNEIIDYINGVEAAFGINLDADEKCCQDHSEQAHSDNDYKEDQLKGNDV